MATIIIKHREFANIVKNTAKMVLPLTSRKLKLQIKLLEVAKEIEAIDAEIDTYQGRVKELAGGLTTEQLVLRKKDAEGKFTQLFEANPEFVKWDEDKHVYVVTIPSEEGTEQAPMTPEENEEAAEAEQQMDAEAEAPAAAEGNDDLPFGI